MDSGKLSVADNDRNMRLDQQYWHNAWAKSDSPGWQQNQANEALTTHWNADNSAVFVPLCGRSPDLEWLHRQGHRVIGVELSEDAVVRFFEERQIDYQVSVANGFQVYSAERYQVFAGDFFALGADDLTGIEKVYDRAAMVAMSAELRPAYVAHLQSIVPGEAEYFINLLEYDQSLMNGPPFSFSETELRRYFASTHEIGLLAQREDDFSHRGVDVVLEKTYRLHCKKP